jgi:hypothetical protein
MPKSSKQVRAQPADRPAVERDAARLRPDEAAEHVEQGRLARSVRADHSGHLARRDGQRHTVEGREPAKAHRHTAHVQHAGLRRRVLGRRRVSCPLG